MKYVIPVAVFLLMVSVGASLRPGELLKNWRRLSLGGWGKLWLSTFVIPPAIVLMMARVVPLSPAEVLGLYLVSVAPGAPLMSRNMAKRGFDLQLAASYQIWGALLTPLMIPVMVWIGGQVYGKDIWVGPWRIAEQIAEKQFLPFVLGLALARFIPRWTERFQPALVKLGSWMILAGFAVLLIALGPKLLEIGLWSTAAAIVLATGAIASTRWLLEADEGMDVTYSLCNANRHVGLALLLAGQEFHASGALPALVSYALAAMVVMTLYTKMREKRHAAVAA